MTWDALTWSDRLAAVRIGRTFTVRGQETVRAWLIRHHQTSRLIEVLWQPLAVASLNESIDVAAAAPFARVLTEMLSGRARDAAIAMPAKPLDEMYALPARDYIEGRGGEVRTSTPASIVCNGDGTGARVMVRDRTLPAPTVICAVPWWALPETFVNAPRSFAPVLEAAAGTAASPIVTVNLWFDRVVTDHVLVGLPGRAMQWVFDKRRAFGERASHLSLVSSGADSLVAQPNDQLIQAAMREVVDALPAARNAVLKRAVVVRERRATFSVAPGQPLRPSIHTPLQGVLLASDWIDTGLPATIESAVRSGHMAAAAAV
jgi:zeta-carotene desaturase